MATTKALKQRRTKLGLSQVALAAMVGVSQQSIAKWESGEAYPRASQLPALAKALSCSIDELYTSTEVTAQ